MNTWGPDWGERGFFRIARGDDESAFESMAVAADVVLPTDTDTDARRQPPQPAESAERGVEVAYEMADERSLLPSRSHLRKRPHRRHRRRRRRWQQAALLPDDDATATAQPDSIPLDAAAELAERIGLAALLPATQPGAGPGAWRQPSAAAFESAMGSGVLPRPVDSVPMMTLPREMQSVAPQSGDFWGTDGREE